MTNKRLSLPMQRALAKLADGEDHSAWSIEESLSTWREAGIQ